MMELIYYFLIIKYQCETVSSNGFKLGRSLKEEQEEIRKKMTWYDTTLDKLKIDIVINYKNF